MEKFCLSSTQSPSVSHPFLPLFTSFSRASKRVNFPITNPKKFSIFASKDDTNDNSNLNEWDLMELKFGKMLGEDPKLTLAKVMGRKLNPDASYIDIEKNFNRNKGKLVEVKEVPFDVPEKLGAKKNANGLNLVKPVPKKGIVVGSVGNDSPSNGLNLVKPVPKKGIVVGGVGNDSPLPDIKRPSGSIKTKSASSKSNVPNVILRKPSVFNDYDDDDADSESRMRIKRNLTLSMSTEPVKEKFSGMTLLKKPQPSLTEEESDGGNENDIVNGLVYDGLTNGLENDFEEDRENGEQNPTSSSSEVPLLEKPTAFLSQNTEEDALSSMPTGIESVGENHVEAFTGPEGYLISKDRQPGEGSQTRMQHLEQTDAGYTEKEIETRNPSTVKATASESFMGSVLLGRPKKLEARQAMPYPNHEGAVSARPGSFGGEVGPDKLSLTRPLRDSEESDWTRVEQLFSHGDRVDVELISCSPRGFVASFGPLIGFLPYRNLAAKWKFLAFESWLRKNDLDPSKYRQSLGVIGNDEGRHMSMSLEYPASPEVSLKTELKVTADMDLEDLLRIYDLEKIQYLSSYVGQRIKVNILYADRKSRKLIFSMRPKEKEETVEKKRNLMKKLAVGDVVKCCIKKITYFGIFVEVEGVPALVHQSEVSWDYTLNPASYLKIGEIVEAKVHQLDFSLERIFLSLKEITPDPLNEALECIVGNNNFNGGLEAAQADSEWAEVDSLIKEIQDVDGVQTVSKGRFFLSPGLAPTFQVYMASMFENQYKLLARSGNKVQEVIVQASLDKEDMKTAILKCTNRVEL
ncbi:uncharacterized protein LOC141653556 [Silene latifolia]|uniref:uncharacterized protein LOC141653556 n=1 Tax=Silene latifolia TaxID=37657 RepID=UPI003D788933